MNMLLAAAVMALTPAVPGEVKEPRSVDYSGRSTSDLAGCIVLKLAQMRGYEVLSTPQPNGIELALRFRVVGVPARAATFLVEDVGDRRRLTIFATGRAKGAPRLIAESVRPCAAGVPTS